MSSSNGMVYCWCGKEAMMRTSWTSRNPGRRFYCCPSTVCPLTNYCYSYCRCSIIIHCAFLNQGSRCNFFGWYDPEMCKRSMEIIPGLLRSKNEVESLRDLLEAKLRASEEDARLKKKYLVFSWIFFAFFLLCSKFI
jgi:hypothetical protein